LVNTFFRLISNNLVRGTDATGPVSENVVFALKNKPFQQSVQVKLRPGRQPAGNANPNRKLQCALIMPVPGTI